MLHGRLFGLKDWAEAEEISRRFRQNLIAVQEGKSVASWAGHLRFDDVPMVARDEDWFDSGGLRE